MPFFSLAAPKPKYSMYKSQYGPKYHLQPHAGGITSKTLFRVAPTLAGFGGVALFTVIFLASGIPRVQDDILKKIPILGQAKAYDRSVPASDSPF